MYSINCILSLHKFQLYVSGPFPPNSRFTFDYYWSYTFFRYSLDNTKFLGCDSTDMVTLVDGMLASEYPTANPQALFILNEIYIWSVGLQFFIHLEKENDDVTKMKFVNL